MGDGSMTGCSWPAFGTIVLLLFIPSARAFSASPQSNDPESILTELLSAAAELSPGACDPPYGPEADAQARPLEIRVFDAAAAMITTALNAEGQSPRPPSDRATELLRRLEAVSARVNSAWPEESRFHFEVLDVPPALVVKASIRTSQRFFVFGIPEEDSNGNRNERWVLAGSDERQEAPVSVLDLFPVHRGPSGRARFLAKFIRSGCAGTFAVTYDVREWVPGGMGALDQIVKQVGTFGVHVKPDDVPGFPEIGTLQTEGAVISLPYCWYSRIDTWDNPSLCAVDTYDLSRDAVRFESRTYNRPDLVPIAKAIEHAMRHDYPAVLGYCASGEIARRLVRDMARDFFAEDLRVTHPRPNVEHVEFGFEAPYSFDVEKRGGRWMVTAFTTK
jgi:hypothetical protein